MIRPDDVEPLDALFALIADADGHQPLGEHKYLDLVQGHSGSDRGLVGVSDGEIMAYIALAQHQVGNWAMELAFHPLHRARSLMDQAIAVGVATIEEAGGDRVRVWAFQPHLVQALLAAGFSRDRELRQLWVALPVASQQAIPAGIRFASFRVGVDEKAWLDVNNRAFAEHPENGAWTAEVLADRSAQPWFEPRGFILAWEGHDLVGFCWTKVHHTSTGEIYVIAVDPSHQGGGLGRALLEAGLERLGSVGCIRAILYVDADNPSAIGLYDRLGFELDHVDRSFERVL